jgi:hypothetical protein
VRLAIELASPEREPSPPSPAPAPEPAPEPRRGATGGGEGSGLTTGGVVVGAAGVVAVAVGALAGLLTLSWRSELKDAVDADTGRCDGSYPQVTCDPAARTSFQEIEDRAFTASTISNVALIGGVALLAGGAVMLLVGHGQSGDRRAAFQLTGRGLAASF